MMKRIISILLLLLCLVPTFSLNAGAQEDAEFERFYDHCIKEAFIAENERDAFYVDGDTDIGSVAILVARIAGADIFPETEAPSEEVVTEEVVTEEATTEEAVTEEVTTEEAVVEVTPISEEELAELKRIALIWAVEQNIIAATEDINAPVSREDFAVILNDLATYLELEIKADEDVLEDYIDAELISEEALEAVIFAISDSNMLLSSSEVIRPGENLSNKELLKGVMNFDKKVDKEVKAKPDAVAKEEKKAEPEKTHIAVTVTLSLVKGFWETLKIFAVTLIFALPLGLIFSFASMSRFKPVKWFMKVFIWIIRGTPLMLQLIIIFYGPGLLGNWAADIVEANPTMNLFVSNFFLDFVENVIRVIMEWLASWGVFDRFLAVAVAFIINYSCYFSEIFRGGIESISKGQYEAGQVLGMTKIQVFFRVVLLQVVKRIIPPMSNEIITLVKDTSLARTISVYEIIWAGQAFIKSDGLIWPLFYTGAFYLIFNGLLTILFGKLEKKLDYFRG